LDELEAAVPEVRASIRFRVQADPEPIEESLSDVAGDTPSNPSTPATDGDFG